MSFNYWVDDMEFNGEGGGHKRGKVIEEISR
jgi:hypothetical protein